MTFSTANDYFLIPQATHGANEFCMHTERIQYKKYIPIAMKFW